MKFLQAFFCIAASLACVVVFAQQRPYYTQYILNNFIINPAVAGIENYTDVKLSHRHQWVGLQGAPVTTYFTIHAPLKKDPYGRETATSFHANGQNPRGSAYWRDYQTPAPHHGIGMTILNDATGPLNRFVANVAYAYHLSLNATTNLSMGVSVGISQLSLNADKLNFGLQYPSDPAAYGNGILNKLAPDLSSGIWLYSKNYFIGISAQNVIPQKVTFANSSNTVPLENGGKQIPHFFAEAGYRMFLSDDVSFLPSIMIRAVSPIPLGIDCNAKIQYQDLLWVGATYRYTDGFAAMLGINASNTFNVSYAYDLTTSAIGTVSSGTHEIVLGFLLNNKYGDWCPKNIW